MAEELNLQLGANVKSLENGIDRVLRALERLADGGVKAAAALTNSFTRMETVAVGAIKKIRTEVGGLQVQLREASRSIGGLRVPGGASRIVQDGARRVRGGLDPAVKAARVAQKQLRDLERDRVRDAREAAREVTVIRKREVAATRQIQRERVRDARTATQEIKKLRREEARAVEESTRRQIKAEREAARAAAGRIAGLQRRVASFDNTIRRVGSGLLRFGAILGGLFVGGGIAAALKGAAEFEKSVANVGTILGEAAPKLGLYREQILAIAKTSSKSLVDLTTGFYDAISAGIPATLKAGGALDLLNSAQKAATAGLGTTKDAVNAGTRILNTFGEAAGSIPEIFDKIFATIRVGVVTFPVLAQNIGEVAGVASNFNVTFEETLAAIAQTTRILPGREAFTAVRALFVALAAPTVEAKKRAKEYGIELSKTALKTKGLIPLLKEIAAETEGDASKFRQLIPELNAVNAAFALLQNEGIGFTKSLEGITNAAGDTDEALKVVRKTFLDQLALTRNIVDVLASEVFQEIAPLIIEALTSIRMAIREMDPKDVAEGFRSFADTIKSTISFLTVFGSTVVKVFAFLALRAITKFLAGGMAKLILSFKWLRTQTTLFNVVLKGTVLNLKATAATAPKVGRGFALASVAARGFGIALRFALGPLGLIIIGIEALSLAFDALMAAGTAALEALNESIDAAGLVERKVSTIIAGTLLAQKQAQKTAGALINAVEAEKIALEGRNATEKDNLETLKTQLRSRDLQEASIERLTEKEQGLITLREKRIRKLEADLVKLDKRFGFGPRDEDQPEETKIKVTPELDEAAEKKLLKEMEELLDEIAGLLDERNVLGVLQNMFGPEEGRRLFEIYGQEGSKALIKEFRRAADDIREISANLSTDLIDSQVRITEATSNRFGKRLIKAAQEHAKLQEKFAKKRAERLEKEAEEELERLRSKAERIAVMIADSLTLSLDIGMGNILGVFDFIGNQLNDLTARSIEAGNILAAGLSSGAAVLVAAVAEAVAFAGGITEDPAGNLAAAQEATGERQDRERELKFAESELRVARQTKATPEEIKEALERVETAEKSVEEAVREEAVADRLNRIGALNVALEDAAADIEQFLDNVIENFPRILDRLPELMEPLIDKLAEAMTVIAASLIRKAPALIAAGIKAFGVFHVRIVTGALQEARDFLEDIFGAEGPSDRSREPGREPFDQGLDPTGGRQGAGGLKPLPFEDPEDVPPQELPGSTLIRTAQQFFTAELPNLLKNITAVPNMAVAGMIPQNLVASLLPLLPQRAAPPSDAPELDVRAKATAPPQQTTAPTIVFNARGGAPAVVAKAFADMFVAEVRRDGVNVQSAGEVARSGVRNFPRSSEIVES